MAPPKVDQSKKIDQSPPQNPQAKEELDKIIQVEKAKIEGGGAEARKNPAIDQTKPLVDEAKKEKPKEEMKEADIIKLINKEREKIDIAEKKHQTNAIALIRFMNLRKNNIFGYEQIIENYAQSFSTLVDSFEPMVKLESEYSGYSKEKLENFRKIAGNKLLACNTVILPQPDGNFALSGKLLIVPASYPELQQMKEEARICLLFTRRDIYLKTGNLGYESAFFESQNYIDQKLRKDSALLIEDACKEDSKMDFDKKEYDAAKENVEVFTDSIIQHYSDIERYRINDPEATVTRLVEFRQTLKRYSHTLHKYDLWDSGVTQKTAWDNREREKRDIPYNYPNPIENIGKYPALREAFTKIVDTHLEQADIIATQISTQNPEVLKFLNEFSHFFNAHGEVFRQSTQEYLTSRKEYLENYLESVARPEARIVLENLPFKCREISEFFKKIEDSYSIEKMGKEASSAFYIMKADIDKEIEYVDAISSLAYIILDLEGAGDGVDGLVIDALKALPKAIAKFILIAATAAVSTFLVASTMGAGTPAVVIFLANVGVLAFGSTVGRGLGEGIFEGDWSGFVPENFMKAWTVNMVIGAAIGPVSQSYGMTLKNSASKTLVKQMATPLPPRAQQYFDKYVDRLAKVKL